MDKRKIMVANFIQESEVVIENEFMANQILMIMVGIILAISVKNQGFFGAVLGSLLLVVIVGQYLYRFKRQRYLCYHYFYCGIASHFITISLFIRSLKLVPEVFYWDIWIFGSILAICVIGVAMCLEARYEWNLSNGRLKRPDDPAIKKVYWGV